MADMKKCFLCGRYTYTERHHIFNGADRKKSEKYKLVVDLCPECHRTGKYAVHNCIETKRKLQRYGQQKAMIENDWNTEDFLKVFGRNYL